MARIEYRGNGNRRKLSRTVLIGILPLILIGGAFTGSIGLAILIVIGIFLSIPCLIIIWILCDDTL